MIFQRFEEQRFPNNIGNQTEKKGKLNIENLIWRKFAEKPVM